MRTCIDLRGCLVIFHHPLCIVNRVPTVSTCIMLFVVVEVQNPVGRWRVAYVAETVFERTHCDLVLSEALAHTQVRAKNFVQIFWAWCVLGIALFS